MTSSTRPVGVNDLATDKLGEVHNLERTEIEEAALGVAAAATGTHPCELDPNNDVTTCTHLDHARDAADCRGALVILGLLTPGQRPAVNTLRPRKRSRGRCQVCDTRRYLTTAGLVLVHDNADGDHCDGSLRKPTDEALEVS